jgi:hypothetical protein
MVKLKKGLAILSAAILEIREPERSNEALQTETKVIDALYSIRSSKYATREFTSEKGKVVQENLSSSCIGLAAGGITGL